MNDTDSLKGLIEMAVERHQTSARQLAIKAQEAGLKITYTTLNQIRSNTYKFVPGEQTLRAIAWLAGVDESVAFTAAGQPVPGPPLADELPPGADNLSPKSRKAIVDMVRVLVDLESSNHAEQPAASTNSPRKLRAVEPDPDHPSQEQKTNGEEYTITEIHGTDTAKYPVPPIEQLAAHPHFETQNEKFERIHGERGEESQDFTVDENRNSDS